jgi:hypothetical protein
VTVLAVNAQGVGYEVRENSINIQEAMPNHVGLSKKWRPALEGVHNGRRTPRGKA